MLWAAATLVFFVQQLLPGDQAIAILGSPAPAPTPPQQLAPTKRNTASTTRSLTAVLALHLGPRHGDLGTSYQYKQPVTDDHRRTGRADPGADRHGAARLGARGAADPAHRRPQQGGLLARLGLGGLLRRHPALLARGWCCSSSSPSNWLFPVTGGTSPDALLLPALTLAMPLAGFLGQVTRDEFERGLNQPFAISARTRGTSDSEVRASTSSATRCCPAITLTGWAIGATISGAVLVEISLRPARPRPDAGQRRRTPDLPLVVGVTMLVAFIYVVVNLLVDLALRDRRSAPARMSAARCHRDRPASIGAPAPAAPCTAASGRFPTGSAGCGPAVIARRALPRPLRGRRDRPLAADQRRPARRSTSATACSRPRSNSPLGTDQSGREPLHPGDLRRPRVGPDRARRDRASGSASPLLLGIARRARQQVGRRRHQPPARGPLRLPGPAAGAVPRRDLRLRASRPRSSPSASPRRPATRG